MKNQTFRMTMLFDFYGELLTERQKELLREFDESNKEDAERHNPRAKSWMDRVRDFFAAS